MSERDMDPSKLRSQDIERKLLGCLILDEEKRVDLELKLSSDLFVWPAHRSIYSTIYTLENREDVNVDLSTVVEELRKKDDSVSASYVTKCVDKTVSPANAESYFNQLYDLYYRRKLVKSSDKNKKIAYDFNKDIDEITAKAENSLFNLTSEAKKSRGYNKVSDNMINYIEELQDTDPNDPIVGIKTPIKKLNEWTGGLKPGETTIIAARPEMGKSTIASNIIQYAAVENGVPAGFYSLEMLEKKLIIRMLANEANINSHKIRNGTASPENWDKITTLASNIYESPLYINDNPGLTIQEIRSDARRMKAKEGIELLVIDYVEKVGYEGQADKKSERIFKVAEQISDMNKELGIHTILLSQVNRKCEYRQDKRPRMSDLKASSGLEQEANIILFLYRESYYNQNIPTKFKNLTEFYVGKNRDGGRKRCVLDFKKQYNRFNNCPAGLASEYNNWLRSD